MAAPAPLRTGRGWPFTPRLACCAALSHRQTGNLFGYFEAALPLFDSAHGIIDLPMARVLGDMVEDLGLALSEASSGPVAHHVGTVLSYHMRHALQLGTVTFATVGSFVGEHVRCTFELHSSLPGPPIVVQSLQLCLRASEDPESAWVCVEHGTWTLSAGSPLTIAFDVDCKQRGTFSVESASVSWGAAQLRLARAQGAIDSEAKLKVMPLCDSMAMALWGPDAAFPGASTRAICAVTNTGSHAQNVSLQCLLSGLSASFGNEVTVVWDPAANDASEHQVLPWSSIESGNGVVDGVLIPPNSTVGFLVPIDVQSATSREPIRGAVTVQVSMDSVSGDFSFVRTLSMKGVAVVSGLAFVRHLNKATGNEGADCIITYRFRAEDPQQQVRLEDYRLVAPAGTVVFDPNTPLRATRLAKETDLSFPSRFTSPPVDPTALLDTTLVLSLSAKPTLLKRNADALPSVYQRFSCCSWECSVSLRADSSSGSCDLGVNQKRVVSFTPDFFELGSPTRVTLSVVSGDSLSRCLRFRVCNLDTSSWIFSSSLAGDVPPDGCLTFVVIPLRAGRLKLPCHEVTGGDHVGTRNFDSEFVEVRPVPFSAGVSSVWLSV